MARDAAETRRRIFEAATAEFARHGIAGARIDRIATAAGANKQLIYAYFGPKRTLFEAVVSEHITRFIEEVPFDPADLATHAVALFDFYVDDPTVAQLGLWHALEPGEAEHPIAVIQQAIRGRARLVAAAQKRGEVNPDLRAADLLLLVGLIARSYAFPDPELQAARARSVGARREAVRNAVRRLAEP